MIIVSVIRRFTVVIDVIVGGDFVVELVEFPFSRLPLVSVRLMPLFSVLVLMSVLPIGNRVKRILTVSRGS